MFSGFILAAFAASQPAPAIVIKDSSSRFELHLGTGGAFRITGAPVRDARTFRLTDGSVIGIWREGTVEHYLASRDGLTVGHEAESDQQIHLKVGNFDPLLAAPAKNALIPTPVQSSIFVVQFKTQPMPAFFADMESSGATVYDTIAPNAAFVRIPVESLSAVRALPYVRWAGKYEASYRLDPALKAPLESGQLGTRRYNIWCFERGAAMQEAVADRVGVLGGSVNALTPQGFIISATLSPTQLAQLLGMDEVCYVDEWSAPEHDMDIVHTMYGGNFIANTLGFTGQGVRAEVMDGGLLLTHQAFQGHPPVQHPGGIVTDSHGTSTYGINFGNGSANPAGKGMLPDAQGVIASYNAFSGGNRYTHTAQLLQSPYFCVYQSNSWGNSLTTSYTTISAEMDDILFQNDITILNSQSNNGNQLSRPQAWAKNVVSIGGFYHFNNTNTADDRWNGGASIGPAADGRYKPELANCYDNIVCPTSTSNTAYTSGFSGTSAATPITAGHFGLFFQMWGNGGFGNAVPESTIFANRPKATLAKAFMINTANQYALPAPNDITRFVQGWGVVDLTNLYNSRLSQLWVNESDPLQNLQTATYKVVIAPSTPALRVTLVYTDPQGNPGSGVARKNNLSLKVTYPSGATSWWGNNGMATSNWTASGGAEDTINTVENVYIPNPTPGHYTIQVIGSDINTDARSETPGVIDADYALVASGVVGMNLPPSSLVMIEGTLLSGGFEQLATSDNQWASFTRGASGTRKFQATAELRFNSPSVSASKMSITIERSNGSPNVVETIEALDVTNGAWVMIGSGVLPPTDGVNTLSVPNPSRFVALTGDIKLRCSYTRQDTGGTRTQAVNVDYVHIRLEP